MKQIDRRQWINLSASATFALSIPKSITFASNKTKKMKKPICTTCGVQYESEKQEHCPVCEDSRQYVNAAGQQWTTLESIAKSHKNVIEKVASNIYAIYTIPDFGIGQRAHLVVTHEGNILWDCISNLDESTVDIIKKLGGIKAIAISHPHYYSTMLEWSQAFDDAPIYIHHADKAWIQRTSPAVLLWEGREKELWKGMKLVLCAGHFDGATILYVPEEGGQLLTGDNPFVCSDLKSVSFMYSFPNYIPLPASAIRFIKESLDPLNYKAIFGAFGKYIRQEGKNVVNFSISRYLEQIR
jgi:glyoxylase-like metal-dependent hydrolase (beta-lactamase superfamily II)